MIALDTNILVHAHRPEMSHHSEAVHAISELARSGKAWAIPFHCLVEFVAVVSNRKIWLEPSPHPIIVDQVAAWREAPRMRILGDEEGAWQAFAECLVTARPVGGAVHDARIAACCLAYGVSELWTIDRDFGRYAGLKSKNPFA